MFVMHMRLQVVVRAVVVWLVIYVTCTAIAYVLGISRNIAVGLALGVASVLVLLLGALDKGSRG